MVFLQRSARLLSGSLPVAQSRTGQQQDDWAVVKVLLACMKSLLNYDQSDSDGWTVSCSSLCRAEGVDNLVWSNTIRSKATHIQVGRSDVLHLSLHPWSLFPCRLLMLLCICYNDDWSKNSFGGGLCLMADKCNRCSQCAECINRLFVWQTTI